MDNKLHAGLIAILMWVALLACSPGPELSPTLEISATSLPASTYSLVTISVFFTDSNAYALGTPPFEVSVTRKVLAGSNFPEAVLSAFFDGPTPVERSLGLEAITSGFDGFKALVIEDGIARVYLRGRCASNGATYTIAQPVIKNLLQFDEVAYVKIYDENGETEIPEGDSNSIPFCLEP